MIQARIQHSQFYHFYNRGNNKESIFKEDQDYLYFLDLYRRYILPLADLYAYCLLPTHFHLLVFIKDLSDMDLIYAEEDAIRMQFWRFLGTYTRVINQQYQRTGHLFAGRHTRIARDQEDAFLGLIASIHQNPQSHGIVADFKVWPYSSYHAYVKRDRRSLLARKLFSDDHLYTTILDRHQVPCHHPDFSAL